MKVISRIALILLVIGGLNRGLFARLDLNLVAKVFPDVTKTVVEAGVETTMTTMSMIAKIIYSLVALSAIYVLIVKLTKKA